MSEHLRPSNEALKHIDTSEQIKQLQEQAEKATTNPEASHGHIDSIRDAIEAAAPTETAAHVTEQGNADSGRHQFGWMSNELRVHGYKETLRKVRKHLSTSEKTLSKVVHQPAVEKMSEIGAKTAFRPSGILVGAILSFSGSLAAYILTKRYGYNLPNSIFSVLFVGGFTIGICGELAYRFSRSLKR